MWTLLLTLYAADPVVGLIVETATGAEQTVMLYQRDTCRAARGLDLPDVQARAFRRTDGTVVVVSGNAPVNYWMTGPSFDELRRDCNAVLTSGDKADAASFDNQEWILATWREGEIVHALVHNEYHDRVAPNCRVGVNDPSNPCWWNAITYARSSDGGRTFTQGPAPGHVVAALPTPWSAASPRGAPAAHGYFTPSNIVRGADGFFYSMFMSIPDPANPQQGTCVMRTNNLGDPASWRAWDGSGYNLTMRSPYTVGGQPAPTGLRPCTPVAPETIGSLHGSLTWNNYLERYVLVGNYASGSTCGSFLSYSADLLRWSRPQLLLEGTLPYPPCERPEGSFIYPSLIDHESPSVNFETTGARPHLYYVKWNRGLDRDLVRRPLELRARAAVANAASYDNRGVAPGQLVALFGEGLAGGRVFFDGVAAPVLGTTAGQINLVAPHGIAGRGETRIEVEVNGVRSRAVSAPVLEPTPGLFTLNRQGTGQAAALLADFRVNGTAAPVAPGGVLLLYGTAGQASGVDGAVAAAAVPYPGNVTARVGGVIAEVLYAGTAPGLIQGALQVNVRVPASVPTGNAVPVVIEVNGRVSQAGVTVVVR